MSLKFPTSQPASITTPRTIMETENIWKILAASNDPEIVLMIRVPQSYGKNPPSPRSIVADERPVERILRKLLERRNLSSFFWAIGCQSEGETVYSRYDPAAELYMKCLYDSLEQWNELYYASIENAAGLALFSATAQRVEEMIYQAIHWEGLTYSNRSQLFANCEIVAGLPCPGCGSPLRSAHGSSEDGRCSNNDCGVRVEEKNTKRTLVVAATGIHGGRFSSIDMNSLHLLVHAQDGSRMLHKWDATPREDGPNSVFTFKIEDAVSYDRQVKTLCASVRSLERALIKDAGSILQTCQQNCRDVWRKRRSDGHSLTKAQNDAANIRLTNWEVQIHRWFSR